MRTLVEFARDQMDTDVLAAAEKAWRYYHMKVDQDPLGAREINGEVIYEGSRVVEAVARDTISALLPDIYRVFLSSHEVVEFEPRGAEDVEPAKQATDVISARFWRKGGAKFLYGTLLDWLIKFCAVRVYHEPVYEEEVSEFEGLQETEVQVLMEDPELVEIDAEPYEHPIMAPGPNGAPLQVTVLQCYRGKYRRKVLKQHEHKFASIPQEELLLDLEAKSLDAARIIGTDSRRTVDEVVGLGIPYETVRMHVTDGLDARRSNMTRTERAGGDDMLSFAGHLADTATRYVRVVDAHVRLDRDDDGLAETYHIICLGENATLVDAWEEDWPTYIVDSPCPIPHQIIGEGVAEIMLDRQEISTALVRRFLDNLNSAMRPRSIGELDNMQQKDDIESLYGGHIDAPASAVSWFSVPFVGQYAMQALEYFKQTDMLRSGVSFAGQGLDPDVLQNQTVAGAKAIVSAPQSRTDFYVRLFAEGVMAPLFRGLLKLHVQFPPVNETIRIRNEWIPIDPRAWQADYDCDVRVGLGHGTRDEKMLGLQLISAKIEALLASGSPLVDLEKYHNVLTDMGALVGIRDSRRYLNDATPEMEQQAGQQAQQAKQEAVQMQGMVEQAKASAKAQADSQVAQMKGQIQAQLDAAEAAAKERQILLEGEIKQKLTALEMQFEIALQRMSSDSKNGRGNSQLPSHVQ